MLSLARSIGMASTVIAGQGLNRTGGGATVFTNVFRGLSTGERDMLAFARAKGVTSAIATCKRSNRARFCSTVSTIISSHFLCLDLSNHNRQIGGYDCVVCKVTNKSRPRKIYFGSIWFKIFKIMKFISSAYIFFGKKLISAQPPNICSSIPGMPILKSWQARMKSPFIIHSPSVPTA